MVVVKRQHPQHRPPVFRIVVSHPVHDARGGFMDDAGLVGGRLLHGYKTDGNGGLRLLYRWMPDIKRLAGRCQYETFGMKHPEFLWKRDLTMVSMEINVRVTSGGH
jgi:hypothetical protein